MLISGSQWILKAKHSCSSRLFIPTLLRSQGRRAQVINDVENSVVHVYCICRPTWKGLLQQRRGLGKKRMKFSRARYSSSTKAVMPTAQSQDGGGLAKKQF